jgi:hypothetical protein
VSVFQSSDRNFLQYRAFFHLHSRLLSALQADIELIERQLDEVDDFDATSSDECRRLCLQDKERDDEYDTMNSMSAEFQQSFNKTRPQLLVDLRAKLLEYGECEESQYYNIPTRLAEVSQMSYY